jgi:hypothetical protein
MNVEWYFLVDDCSVGNHIYFEWVSSSVLFGVVILFQGATSSYTHHKRSAVVGWYSHYSYYFLLLMVVVTAIEPWISFHPLVKTINNTKRNKHDEDNCVENIL